MRHGRGVWRLLWIIRGVGYELAVLTPRGGRRRGRLCARGAAPQQLVGYFIQRVEARLLALGADEVDELELAFR